MNVLSYHEFTCMIFIKLFWMFPLTIFCIVYCCKRTKQYAFINLKACDQFSRKKSQFQRVPSAFVQTFQIPALSRSSWTCTNPGYEVHSIWNDTELNGHIVLIDNLIIIIKTVIKNL